MTATPKKGSRAKARLTDAANTFEKSERMKRYDKNADEKARQYALRVPNTTRVSSGILAATTKHSRSKT